MASTSIRFVTRHPKLRTGATSPSITQCQTTRYGILPSHLSCRPSLSPETCKLSQQKLFSNAQHFSTFSSTCTPQQFSISRTSRWTPRQSAQSNSSATVRLNSLIQRRFASDQPSAQNEKVKAGGLTPTKINAPDILKKALNSTPHENIYTLPNFLTASRLVAAPVIGYMILYNQPVTALALFAYAGVTDLVDGALARRYNSQTVVGTILDPMADKTLMTVAVVCMAVQGLIPVWLAVIILGRDVGLAISACYYRYISLPPPKTFTRYWDFSLPSAEVRPTEISKINTLLQLLLVGNAMVLPVLPVAWVEAWNLMGVFEGWQFLVAGTTIWSGLSYVFKNDAVKILSQEEGERKKVERMNQLQGGGTKQ